MQRFLVIKKFQQNFIHRSYELYYYSIFIYVQIQIIDQEHKKDRYGKVKDAKEGNRERTEIRIEDYFNEDRVTHCA